MTSFKTLFAFLLLTVSTFSAQGAFRRTSDKSGEKNHRGLKKTRKVRFVEKCVKIGLRKNREKCKKLFKSCIEKNTCKEKLFVKKCHNAVQEHKEDFDCKNSFYECSKNKKGACKEELRKNAYLSACYDEYFMEDGGEYKLYCLTKYERQCTKEICAFSPWSPSKPPTPPAKDNNCNLQRICPEIYDQVYCSYPGREEIFDNTCLAEKACFDVDSHCHSLTRTPTPTPPN